MNLAEVRRHISALAQFERSSLELARESTDAAEVHRRISAALVAIRDAQRALDADARRALAAGGDLRPALRRYLRGHAALSGVTVGEQVAAFGKAGNQLFSHLAIAAWGVCFDE